MPEILQTQDGEAPVCKLNLHKLKFLVKVLKSLLCSIWRLRQILNWISVSLTTPRGFSQNTHSYTKQTCWQCLKQIVCVRPLYCVNCAWLKTIQQSFSKRKNKLTLPFKQQPPESSEPTEVLTPESSLPL